MRRKALEMNLTLPGNEFVILDAVFTVRIGLDLVTSPEKKYNPELASTRFLIHCVNQNFYSGERISKVADSYAGLASDSSPGPSSWRRGGKRKDSLQLPLWN